MKPEPKTPTQSAAALLGALGGAVGRGKSKARDPKLCKIWGKRGAAKRWGKKGKK